MRLHPCTCLLAFQATPYIPYLHNLGCFTMFTKCHLDNRLGSQLAIGSVLSRRDTMSHIRDTAAPIIAKPPKSRQRSLLEYCY